MIEKISTQTELMNRIKGVKENYKPEADQAVRMAGIGGSDAGVIMRVNPWKNLIQLWDEKVGNSVAPDLSDNEKIRWGVLLEDLICREYMTRTGRKVRNVNKTFRHPAYPYMQGHIDRKIEGENAGLEAKAVGLRQQKFWEAGPPEHYRIQVMHYMAITGYDYFDVVALVGGQELVIHRIDRDEELIAELIEREKEFWEQVQSKTPPPPVTTAETALLYPTGESEKVVYLSTDMSDVPAKYFKLQAEKKSIDDQLDALKTRVQDKMKDASYLEDSEGERVASWPTYERSSTDLKSIEKAEPELCEKHRKVSSYRRFTFNTKYRRENA